MSNKFPITGYFTNADSVLSTKLCIDSQQENFVPIFAGDLLPFEIAFNVLKAVGEKNYVARGEQAAFDDAIKIFFVSYMIKNIGNFYTALRNDDPVIAAQKEMAQ